MISKIAVLALVLVAVTASPVGESGVVPGLPASGVWNTDIAGTFSVVSLPGVKASVGVPKDDESLMSLQPREAEADVSSRLHPIVHLDTRVPPPPNANDIPRSRDVPLFPTRYEEPAKSQMAWSEDGRNEMKPESDEVLDDDCDSPQIGDVEVAPQGTVDVNMNANVAANASLPEQDIALREVLDTDVFASKGLDHVIEADAVDEAPGSALPLEGGNSASELPEPSKEVIQRSKCSRNTNGNDVPDALGELGEDCGMPEPEIPCETPGNSTRCEPRLVLRAPALPPAEKMPPIPAPSYMNPARTVTLNIELPDFGTAVSFSGPANTSLGTAILEASGLTYGVREWHITIVRNAGADVTAERQVGELEDEHQVIVYLRCAARLAVDALIVTLPICEDLRVLPVEVRVEVPLSDDVFVVAANTSMLVQAVLDATPLTHASVDKITYNGARVLGSQTLLSLHFANKSALVVYLTPALAPPTSPLSVVWTPPVQTVPMIAAPPTPGSPPSSESPALPEESINAIGVVPIPEVIHDSWPRPEMTQPAVVQLRINDGLFVDLPVLVRPDDVGGVLFDVLKDSTGRADKYFSLVFHRLRIEVATPLRSFGFVNGDILPVQMLPA